jgi:hypothetical protein
MMREPVEHGGGHLLVAEDLGPFPEGEVGYPTGGACD